MKPSPDGWKPFREWAAKKDYDYHRTTGMSPQEASQAKRETSNMIRGWEREKPVPKHGLYPILLKEWSDTLHGTDRVRLLEPQQGD